MMISANQIGERQPLWLDNNRSWETLVEPMYSTVGQKTFQRYPFLPFLLSLSLCLLSLHPCYPARSTPIK